MRPLRATAFALLLLVPTALLGACATDDNTITVYSGRTENLVGPILADFTEQTGIGVDVRYGDSADLALQIQTEGDRSPADLFISQSPGAMGFLAEEGLLAELATETLDAVEPKYRDEDGRWVGMSGRVRTLVYNTDLVEEADLPESVFDLTGPDYTGKVAVAPANGSFQDFVTAMRADKGDKATEEWLAGMAANDAAAYADNTAIVQAVGRGEIPMGLVNHYYNERAKAETPDVASENHFFGEGDVGSVLLATAAGVPQSSQKKAQAEQLAQFLLSEEAQRFFSEETFEYPLAAGVAPAGDLQPLKSVNATQVDFGDLGGGFRETLEMINNSGLGSQ